MRTAGLLGLFSLLIQLFSLLIPAFALLSQILLLLSHYQLAKSSEDIKIFRYTLIYIAVITVGSVVFFSHIPPNPESIDYRTAWPLFLFFYLCLVASCFFLAKAYHLIYHYTGLKSFLLGGNLIFYGSMGVIVMGIGSIVMLAGWVLVGVAYYKLWERGLAEGE